MSSSPEPFIDGVLCDIDSYSDYESEEELPPSPTPTPPPPDPTPAPVATPSHWFPLSPLVESFFPERDKEQR